MLAFLFLLIIAGNAVILYKFNDKVSVQRRQILSLKYENDDLKSKLSKQTPKKIDIKYVTPQFLNAVVTISGTLHLSPISNSSIVNTLKENTSLKIQDSAQIQSQLWYEVFLPGDNRLNSKGWIKSNYIRIIE
ncbi:MULTISPECIES: hypothetical protein [Clostridium]|uniref:SH3b domain-containing protein n=5 Tax=Clostridium TaxID=1485 RepID=A0A168LD26_9CLOT|nr:MULTISPECIES: hypothetical protein [Clostridium]ADK17196.1 conserved hypothetical protein [Clostridium ljungdahlii DSM 13528]AGY76235.1 hypothetical protein CAETHG_2016 [Clostridium autoethanogenum DSM 10061]ALU36397.1 Hypothetical protein CLAU_1968 [Clostridium autoethanogenum DSM 10061]OAA82993.1 hypothetical protein WY13_03765 [Clostridium ljungdahlii]OAA84627.1 hypothetical protein WX45_00893 [Clostridium ljungdahlii DSM 13528]